MSDFHRGIPHCTGKAGSGLGDYAQTDYQNFGMMTRGWKILGEIVVLLGEALCWILDTHMKLHVKDGSNVVSGSTL